MVGFFATAGRFIKRQTRTQFMFCTRFWTKIQKKLGMLCFLTSPVIFLLSATVPDKRNTFGRVRSFGDKLNGLFALLDIQ